MMHQNMRTSSNTFGAVILGAWILLPGQASAVQTESFEQTYDLGGAGSLVLSNVSGDITVSRSDDALVHVNAVKSVHGRGSSDDALSQVRIDVSHNGDRLRIETVYEKQSRSWGGRSNHVSVRYDVRAPRETEVRLTSVSGDVTLEGIAARSRVKTVSGEVRIQDAADLREAKSVSGSVEVVSSETDDDSDIGSVSGDVTLRDIRASSLSLSTVSGDLRVTEASCTHAELKSVSGDVVYEAVLDGSGRYELKSHSGDLELVLPSGTGFELEAKTFSGSIESEFDMNIETDADDDDDNDRRRRRRRRKNIRASVGDGSARVEVSTFSGDIWIRER